MEEYRRRLVANDVSSINLSDNSIGAEGVKAFATALEKNTSLTSINLARNNINVKGAKLLAAMLENNLSLSSIDLSRNDIGDEGAKALGVALEKNRSLTSVHLGHNGIRDEGAKALGVALEKNRSLTSIDLRRNDVGGEGAKALATALEKNTSLNSIVLEGNNIGVEGAKAFCSLVGNTSLTSINLYSTFIFSDAKILAVVLAANRSLTSIDLTGNTLGDRGAEALGVVLEKNTSLTSINLWGNNIGVEGIKALGAALEKNTSLSSIDLKDNQIGAEGAKALGTVFEKNVHLTFINLYGARIGDEGARTLGAALVRNTSLTCINLGFNSIGDGGAKALCSLAGHASLTSIYLADNRDIGDANVTGLGGALAKTASLTFISLSNSNINDEGARALGAALEKNTSLVSIDLHRNNIGVEGAKALGVALGKNTSLTSMNLVGNGIGDNGAKALGVALGKNTSLTSMNLDYNSIGDNGAEALGVALGKNTSLASMNLNSNNIGIEGAKALERALEGNMSLTSMNLNSNSIGDGGAKALVLRNCQRRDLLFEGVRSGNATLVETLCRNPGGIDAVSLNSDQLTVFHVALDRNHWDCVSALFSYPNCRAILLQIDNLKEGRKRALDELVAKLGLTPVHQRIYDRLVRLFPAQFPQPPSSVFPATASAIVAFQEATYALQLHDATQSQRTQLATAQRKSEEAAGDWRKDHLAQQVERMTKLEEAFETEQRDKARVVVSQLLEKCISECGPLIQLLWDEKRLLNAVPSTSSSSATPQVTVKETEKTLRECHEALQKAMASLKECFVQEADASLKGQQQGTLRSPSLHVEVLKAAERLQGTAKQVMDAIHGEESAFAPRAKARLQTVDQDLHHAQSWMLWAQGEASRLAKVLEAGRDKSAAESAAQEASQKFKRCQQLLRRAKEDLESGEGSEEELKTAQANLQRQRATFEESQHRLLAIRNAGYPEIRCASASLDCALPQVPLITLDQLQSLGPLGDVVGEGGFAQVFRVELAGTGTVAFKRLRGGGSQEAIMQEARPMWGLRHPNLVQLLMVCVEPKSMGLVLEWVEGPALSALLRNSKSQLKDERKLAILRDVLLGLAYMHQLRHTHLDVKSDNVLLCGEQGAAKLSDFGTTKEQRMTVMDTEVAMTLSHSAPEMLTLPRKVSAAADMWSVGMLIYELETKAVPFAGLSLLQVAKAMEGGPLPTLRKDAPLKPLFDRCVVVQPERRASCKELLAMVEQRVRRKCVICLDEKPLTEAVGCNGSKREFVCFACLPPLMESVLQDRKPIQPDGGVSCSCGGSYPLHEMHQRLQGNLFKRWIERREEQRTAAMEQQLRIERGKLRLEAQSRDVAIAGTKECPFCYLRWGPPINCHHVTCHQNLHGCGAQWCWECRCDWSRVRVEGNSAHALNCRFHTNNL